MALYLPIRSLNRSTAIRVGGVSVGPNASAYVDISVGQTRKDLASHSSIGQVIVTGPLSSSNSDFVVYSGVTTSATNLVVTVAAGELRQRSTGAYVTVPGGTTTLAAADGTNPRIDLVVVDNVTGAASNVTGTPAASPVAPATPAGKTLVATATVAAGATTTTLTDARPRP